MDNKFIVLEQFDSLAAATSGAIQKLKGSSDTIVITASTKEPADDSYWFHIEEVED